MTTPIITPASIASSLISIRSVAPEITDAAQNPSTLKAQVGQLVSGTIFGMDQSGEPLLKSDQGNLALKLPFHLPSGTDVVLRMEAAPGGGLRARILSIDGQSPKDFEAKLAANPAELPLTEDAISLTPQLARATAPSAPPSPQQLQQMALLPGDASPAAAQRAAELRAMPGNLPLPEAALPSTPQSAVLLSRSAELPGLVQQLPPGFPLPGRLQAGTVLQFQMLHLEPPAVPPSPTSQAVMPAPLPERTDQRATAYNDHPLTAAAPPAAATIPAPLPARVPFAQAALQNTLAAMSGEALMQPPDPLAAPQSSATPPASIPNPAVTGSATPNAAISQSPTTQNPTIFTAQVIGLEPGGDALLHTPLGILRMPQIPGSPMTEGTQVQLQWIGAQESPAPPAPGNPPPTPPTGGWLPLADRWTSLEDTVALLSTNLPPGASPLAHLPQPGAQLGMQMLFFLTALQQGDLMPWIGRNAAGQLSGRGRQDLLQRLGEDFAALGEPLLNSPSNQWQALLFPVFVEGQLHQARLFVGRHPKEEAEKSDGRLPDTRFVLELTLSRLGDMQLCGLVRKPAPQAIQFDLILRSKRELAPAQRTDIQKIFESGAELTGYKGQILFQHSPEFPQHPLESFTPRTPGFMA